MSRKEEYDLVVVGGGPAGLSAAIRAASEGLSILALDAKGRFGGQAAQATKIENYPGVTESAGIDLTRTMLDQASHFNADLLAPFEVEQLELPENGEGDIVVCDDNEHILGRAVLLSCGVAYRRHNGLNIAAYLDRGITYGTPDKRAQYHDRRVVIIGGANSAGQAALTLAQKFDTCQVTVVVRAKEITDKMSAYLIERIKETGNIEVLTDTEVTKVDSDGGEPGQARLGRVTLRGKTSGNETEIEADRMFILIGADPKTNWLPTEVSRDVRHYIQTGNTLPPETRGKFEESHGRAPFGHETSVRGVFAAGDVRSESEKSVAAAVGDGAATVNEIHRFLDSKKKK